MYNDMFKVIFGLIDYQVLWQALAKVCSIKSRQQDEGKWPWAGIIMLENRQVLLLERGWIGCVSFRITDIDDGIEAVNAAATEAAFATLNAAKIYDRG